MKIINLESFKKMPKGTVFSKYAPTCFKELLIKDETIGDDFFYQNMIGNIECEPGFDLANKCNQMEESQDVSFPLDFDNIKKETGPYGYEKNRLFAIYEKKDVKGMIKRLREALKPPNQSFNRNCSADASQSG